MNTNNNAPASAAQMIVADVARCASNLVDAVKIGRPEDPIPLRFKVFPGATVWRQTPFKPGMTTPVPMSERRPIIGCWAAFSYGATEPQMTDIGNACALMGVARSDHKVHVLLPRELSQRQHPGHDDFIHTVDAHIEVAEVRIFSWAIQKHEYEINYWPDYFARKKNQAGVWESVVAQASEVCAYFMELCQSENSMLGMVRKGPPGSWIYVKDDQGGHQRECIEGIRIEFFDRHYAYSPLSIYDSYPSITVGRDQPHVILPRPRLEGIIIDPHNHQQVIACRNLEEAKNLIVKWARQKGCLPRATADKALGQPIHVSGNPTLG